MSATPQSQERATPTAAGPLLAVRDLRTEFRGAAGTVAAVRDVSFEIAPQERLAIVGESGSGKSAMAMSIVGLVQPPGRVVGGEVLLEGRNLRGLSDAEMSRVRGKEIGLVVQDPMTALDPIRTIGAQLVEAIRRHQDVTRRDARAQARELLGEVGVKEAERRLDDHPHEYSGGMRQRVVIALALANSPKLVIADEPTTALDVTTQAQVLDLLDRLATARGAALMMITHNLGVVAGYFDRVKVMYAGRLVEEASSRSLFRAPAHPYSRALLSCALRPDRPQDGRLDTIGGAPPDLSRPIVGCSFAPRCRLGKDREVCRTKAPEAVEVRTEDGVSVAACHFAGPAVPPAAPEAKP